MRQGEDRDWKVVDFNGAVISDDLSGLPSLSLMIRARAQTESEARAAKRIEVRM